MKSNIAKLLLSGLISIVLFAACEPMEGGIKDVLKRAQEASEGTVSVSLNKTKLTLFKGQSETLVATVKPDGLANKNVTWNTNAPAVATVSNGVVTAVSAGTALITAVTEEGGKTASCTVTVSNKTPVSIVITQDPNKTTYAINDQLDLTGLKATAHFDDDSDEEVIISQLTSIYDFSTGGLKTVTIKYGSAEATFQVSVVSAYVYFDSMGGSSVISIQVLLNNTFSKPEDPEREGCTFDGWYKESGLVNPWNFATDTVTAPVTLYAKWNIKVPLEAISVIGPYLASQPGGASPADPVDLPMGMYLENGNIYPPNVILNTLRLIFSEINNAGKYVNLDLLYCNVESNLFVIEQSTLGKDKVVSLILPNNATALSRESYTPPDVDIFLFNGFSELINVTGTSITYIGRGNFANLKTLETVSFQEVNVIDVNAFAGCSALKNANFLMVNYIEEEAFAYCISLQDVDFYSVKTIGTRAFEKCTSLENLELLFTETIGNNAFSGCTALKNVVFFNLETIGSNAFSDCISLENLQFPALKTIGPGAFSNCIALEKIHFPASTNIVLFEPLDTIIIDINILLLGNNPFQGCLQLSFIIDGIIGDLSTKENGKMLVRNNTELVAYPSATGIITISDITIIGVGAFQGCNDLIEVYLPDVTIISGKAFCDVDSLIKISIPNVEYILKGAFSYIYSPILTIEMGLIAPLLEKGIFYSNDADKVINVFVPHNASGYGTIPYCYTGWDISDTWGNQLRRAYENYGFIYENITVIIDEEP